MSATLEQDIRQWDEYINGVGGLESLSHQNRKRNSPSYRHPAQQLVEKDELIPLQFIIPEAKPDPIRVHKLGSRKSRDFRTLNEEDLIREYGTEEPFIS